MHEKHRGTDAQVRGQFEGHVDNVGAQLLRVPRRVTP